MWDNAQDANMRIARSVIRYDGFPVFVHEVLETRDGLMVYYSTMEEDAGNLAGEPVPLTDNGWDFTPVPLGYLNTPRYGALYSSRVPIRKWKQGLHMENFVVRRGERHYEVGEFLNDQVLTNCILGNYPKFKQCLDKVLKDRESAAFHRHYALVPADAGLVWLLHKEDKVGYVADGEAHLGPEYEYLKEELAEAMT